MAKKFASQGDMAEKKITLAQLSPRAYAYTAEGDPNSGFVVGDRAVLVADAQATPGLARALIAKVRDITDKPIRYLVLTHYHAVRVMGASAYGECEVVASARTEELIRERGEADFHSEVGRFPRLFAGVEEVPGLTLPTLTINGELSVDLGGCTARIFNPGRGHTQGDTVVWLEEEKTLFAGDLVEYGATPYCGDAHFSDWGKTIARLRDLNPAAVVPGRGAALQGEKTVAEGFNQTEKFVGKLFSLVSAAVKEGKTLGELYPAVYAEMEKEFGGWVIFEHCMPFNVSRAFDEANGADRPRIWTAERDREMWAQLA